MNAARTVLVAFLSASLVLPCGVRAQQAVIVDQATLDRAVASHVQRSDADRRTIRRLLEHQQVREIAARSGFDIKRAEAAVGTLEGSELQRIAQQAQAVEESLAGGSSVTISTTTIIIALLVLILIIVAVN
ncbi:MAG TPA: PA2779 family protein [Vicinamibacterales bacterium]|nr:PA2779 family protein [Vicinamibacterales bacterium]